MENTTDINRSIYMSFVPEYLRSNKNFLVFLQLAIHEFDINIENIKNFTDLVNPDKVPIEFIEALGSYSNYRFEVNADDDFNREIMMRMQSIYKERGTDKSIIMAATHGNNLGWVGGDIFIPGYNISKESATLVLSKDELFRHDISKHSGSHKFADSEIYRPGIIIINLPYINNDIKKAIDKVLPAGIKYKFLLTSSFIPSDGSDTGEFKELSYFKQFRVTPLNDKEKESDNAAGNMTIDSTLLQKKDVSDIQMFSQNRQRGKRSGRLITMIESGLDTTLGASLLPIDVLKRRFIGDTDGNSTENIIVDIPGLESDLDISYRGIVDSNNESMSLSNNGIIKVNVKDPTAFVDSKFVDVEKQYSKDKYIVSGTGELLDYKNKKDVSHLHRNIDVNDLKLSIVTDKRITARRSTSSAIRGRLGKMSGIIDNVIDCKVPALELSPYDCLYDIDNIGNLSPYTDERDPFFSYGFDIEFIKI